MTTASLQLKGLRGRLAHNASLAKYTSWRAGGTADTLYAPADRDDLARFVAQLPADEPLLAIGLGSNTLVRDGGIRGTVVVMHNPGAAVALADGLIFADAGLACPKLARFAANQGCAEAEFLAGIPGTVGGALAMNAGCYGGETWRYVVRVEVLRRDGTFEVRTPADYVIGYRSVKKSPTLAAGAAALVPGTSTRAGQSQGSESASASVDGGRNDIEAPGQFRNEAAELFTPRDDPAARNGPPKLAADSASEGELFTAAWFRFPPGDADAARDRIRELLARRILAQPLDLPNAGSVFRNPPNDHAARLIEACGLKGYAIGGTRVSEKHANFIVNPHGYAKAADIEALIMLVRDTVRARTGVELEQEVRIVGDKQR
jgi:UDP-N-acetylmuramate dehydrogenase